MNHVFWFVTQQVGPWHNDKLLSGTMVIRMQGPESTNKKELMPIT